MSFNPLEMYSDFIKILDRFAKLLQGVPIEDKPITLTFVVTVLAFGLTVVGFIYSIVKWCFSEYIYWRNKKIANKNLHPFFTIHEINEATQNYIPTKYQNVAPSKDDEPGRDHIASAKDKLLPFFLNKAFKNDSDHNKYYLLLADSGMGKTTFMLNLYLKYKQRWTWGGLRTKYDIQLFPLGHPKTDEKIKAIKDKKNTILLLDAFDEDNKAVKDYKKRMQEILDIVWEFREIVVTCRTQFFPSEAEELTRTSDFKYGPNGGRHKFQKLYISVFSDKDVKKYLGKKYNWLNPWNWKKYRKAKKIAQQSPNLVVRPMLLSHIDDLLNTDRTYDYTFQIYEELIQKWIEREARKRGVQERYNEGEYEKALMAFSDAFTKDLILNKNLNKRKGRFAIHKDDIIAHTKGLQLFKEIEKNVLSEGEQRSRSLLNRDAQGYYKFSHKSVLEYFYAKLLFKDLEFRNRFTLTNSEGIKYHPFVGMDAAKSFYKEMIINQFDRGKNKKAKKIIGELEESKILHLNLKGVNLKGMDLRFVNLQFAKLQEADLRGVNLLEANLQEAILRFTDLRFTNLRGANLQEADLQEAILSIDWKEQKLINLDYILKHYNEVEKTDSKGYKHIQLIKKDK